MLLAGLLACLHVERIVENRCRRRRSPELGHLRVYLSSPVYRTRTFYVREQDFIDQPNWRAQAAFSDLIDCAHQMTIIISARLHPRRVGKLEGFFSHSILQTPGRD